ncbi:MAG: ornithine carbamoyltransferase [Sulfurihydrogenibium sp.]|jgi:ornithine carbamoyltransferase|uniref:Ornithine carbamoyltransferase n=1 Tax=Sulfurihydrogenibium azorense TaxID=309806 RepID=A0A832DQB4_9AQUI|nr:MAG: ornithine carbamoyltransferase [Sulfurihydrogenibium sp.]PMP77837.1 MAG: ornithine carbamoyltransferase [Sulfurihydrogenibium sp.]HEV08959.1 ornithine carbamoyltransferase [Sulfurihydrogenibium azorense]
MPRSFVSFTDLTKEEVLQIIEYGKKLKKDKFLDQSLKGKSIGLIFMKQSTRTRLSFEVGVYQMGGQPIYISASSTQISRGEDIKDTARVMGRYLDGIVIRTFSHKEVEDLANYSGIPVINALTDYQHPCQVLADLMTITEVFGTLENKKIAYVGDGNNMANTLLLAAALMGMDISVATPPNYEPNGKAVLQAVEIAKQTGSKIEITNDPKKAVLEADVLYTDVWVSMGQEGDKDKKKLFEGFTINKDLVLLAKPEAVVMHCLPAHKGEEISEDVFEQYSDVIFNQAENRLHVQKALMSFLFKNQ